VEPFSAHKRRGVVCLLKNQKIRRVARRRTRWLDAIGEKRGGEVARAMLGRNTCPTELEVGILPRHSTDNWRSRDQRPRFC